MGKQIDNELSELLAEFNRIRKPLLHLLTVHGLDYVFVPDDEYIDLYTELIESGEYDKIKADAYKRLEQRIEHLQVEEFTEMYSKADKRTQKRVNQMLRG